MTVTELACAFLGHHLRFNPVDATFMGVAGHDGSLPPADADAPGREDAALSGLSRSLDAAPPPNSPGEAMDLRLLRNMIGHARRLLAERPRYRDPTWYTGETAFGLISLMLPSATPDSATLDSRLAEIPRFLAEGARHLAGAAAFEGWTARARHEVEVIRRLLQGRLPLHPLWRATMADRMPAALAALAGFDAVVAGIPDADPRCGRDHLGFVMREVHVLPFGPEEAIERAEAAMAGAREDLVAMAARLDPARSWQEQLADLNRIAPEPDRIVDAYRAFHDQAMAEAEAFLTPATEYGLTFQPFPDWAQGIYPELYFLAYRCPPGARAGPGSVYWTAPPGQSTATIKSTHAVHHGSIGHHTQNARARAAPSHLARIANQGVARGIAFQAGGTMGEGWSCYVQDLMLEAPGFYTPAERLLARSNELRNAACLVADIRFHTREWDIGTMRRYYRDVAGFPPGRLAFETVKNSLFPGNRLMYWLGVEQIKAARARWTGGVRTFHDGLIARGHVPLTWAIEDLFADAA